MSPVKTPIRLAKKVVGGQLTTPVKQGKQAYEDALRRLSEASVEHYFNAFVDIEWDSEELAVDPHDRRWILPEVDALGAHPWYQSLPVERQIEVGRHRLAQISKTGSQFEMLLLGGAAQFLLRAGNENPEFRYFLHEITEETHHIQMFQEFVNRVYPDVHGAPGWFAPATPFIAQVAAFFPALFFCIILAGEEPIDHLQKDVMRRGGAHPLISRVMQIHIAEEARHIGFAHAWLEQHVPDLDPVRKTLLGVIFPLAMRIGADAIMIPSRPDLLQMGIPDEVAAEVWWHSEDSARIRRTLFSDVRMLSDGLGLRSPLTRWAWRVFGVDGTPARYRSEPARASA